METETENDIFLDCFFTVESDFKNSVRINRDGDIYLRTISDFYSVQYNH